MTIYPIIESLPLHSACSSRLAAAPVVACEKSVFGRRAAHRTLDAPPAEFSACSAAYTRGCRDYSRVGVHGAVLTQGASYGSRAYTAPSSTACRGFGAHSKLHAPQAELAEHMLEWQDKGRVQRAAGWQQEDSYRYWGLRASSHTGAAAGTSGRGRLGGVGRHQRSGRRTGAAAAVEAAESHPVSAAAGGTGGGIEGFEDFLLAIQEKICQEASEADGSGATFITDKWQRNPSDPSAGYGITRVLEGGQLLEKAAANVSIIRGCLSKERAQAMSQRGQGAGIEAGAPYSAAALSLVFHSAHPMIPTFRADVRNFQVAGKSWFGGGADLTPSYLNEEDTHDFHRFYKDLCDSHEEGLYEGMKETCDKYFYIPARKEHRGVGGIFFDDLEALGPSSAADGQGPARALAFVRAVAEGFMPSFLPLAERRRGLPFGDAERRWQLLRRGRYLEFNLLYDRGVRFGLEGGRIESIMVSAPPLIAWQYNVQPEPGSREAALLEVLRKPRSWV